MRTTRLSTVHTFIAPAQTPVPQSGCTAALAWRRVLWGSPSVVVRSAPATLLRTVHTRVPRTARKFTRSSRPKFSRINLQRRPSFLPAVCAGALNGVDVDNLLRSSASTLAVVRQGRHDRRHRFVESAACARFRRPFHCAFMSHSGPVGERPGDDGRCQQAAGRPGPLRLPRG